MAMGMKTTRLLFCLSSLSLLAACSDTVNQWIDPDRTFASLPQPDVAGINATQEQSAKEAIAAGDFRRAAEFYEQLVGSKKGTAEEQLRYKLGLADAMRRQGDNDHALAMFNQLYSENPTNLDAAEGRALTLMATGKTVDAGRAFSDIMDKDPNRWRTLNALGILFVTKDMIPEAMAYYTEALKHSPDNPAVLNNVGLSQAVDHQYPRAIEALQQSASFAKTPQQRKQIDLNLAMVYGVSGDLDTAKEIAAKYLDGAALDNNLGLYAHLSKDDALAKTYLNMALSQSPTFYERAWNNLDVVNDSTAHGTGEGAQTGAPLPVYEGKK
jgi:Flp pilus assembly protein TadD